MYRRGLRLVFLYFITTSPSGLCVGPIHQSESPYFCIGSLVRNRLFIRSKDSLTRVTKLSINLKDVKDSTTVGGYFQLWILLSV